MTANASFHLFIQSSNGDSLVHLNDASSERTLVLGRVSLRGGLTRSDPFFSRNHARVEIADVGVGIVAKLIPIHQNPCYVVRRAKENVVEV